MVALHGYLEGYHPPGRTSHVLWKRVGRILLDAHRVAVRAVHDLCDAKPGLAVQLPLLVPARDDPASRAFCAELEAEIVDLYLDGLVGPDRGDWLGVQYYRKQWVDPASPTFFAPPPAGTHVTQMGWAVHPDGLRHMLQLAGARTGLPLYVTENGIATEDDRERIDYLESHLRAVARARREGVDVRGYLHWSAFDNFEWSEGYRPKFGLIAVDRTDGYRRTPKSSALALARVAASGRIDALRA
jgi:beta-glucosidase